MAKECPNCGCDVEAVCLGEIPCEELVSDEIRLDQYRAAMRGEEFRHSVCIAVQAPQVAQ